MSLLHPPAEAHSGPSLVSNIDTFARVVNGFIWALPTFFAKSSIVDIWRGPELIKCLTMHEEYISFDIIKLFQVR